MDEITPAPSPSSSFVSRTPPEVLRNLWEDLVDARSNDEPSVWDTYPRTIPRTSVDLDDEVTDGHNDSVETRLSHTSHYALTFIDWFVYCVLDIVGPLVHAWTIEADESFAASTCIARDIETAKSTVESAGPSRTASLRIPRLAPTPAWKKTINALVSGDGNKATRPVRALTSATSAVSSANLAAPASLPVTSSNPDASKKLDWSEDVEQTLSSPSGDITAERKIGKKPSVWVEKQVSKVQGRVFEKCDCALENALFEPESWNKFKIPTSCHPRPPIHFLSPRDSDRCNPSTRIVVDNVNAFRHHSMEPNVPYPNKDIEDLFYSVGAKNVRCFDGRIVGGVVRYNTSYAIVDFGTVEDAKAAFKAFQGRKAYPDSYHLRLKFVDTNDRTFGRRMTVSMGPMERSGEERKAFVEFVEDLDRVDVDLSKVVLPSRPGFALPARPVTPSRP